MRGDDGKPKAIFNESQKLRGDDGKPKAIFNERNWEEMIENLRQFLMKEIERRC